MHVDNMAKRKAMLPSRAAWLEMIKIEKYMIYKWVLLTLKRRIVV